MICLYSQNTQAQSLKDILSGVADKVAEYAGSDSQSVVGTWTYTGPDCKFKSDNLLAKAGASIAASKVNDKLKKVYSKAGMEGLKMTFNADSTYTSVIKGHDITGTYTYDQKEKTVTLKPKTGAQIKMHTSLTGTSLSLMFESDKLLEGVKSISSLAAKTNSTASLISSFISNYDGMLLGFKMKKQ